MQPKGVICVCPYHWTNGMKKLSGCSNLHRVWKGYQGVIHKTYHGGNIETDHHVI